MRSGRCSATVTVDETTGAVSLDWKRSVSSPTSSSPTPSPSRADVSAALVRAHSSLPFMRRPSRSLPQVHASYAASRSTVDRVLRQQKVIDKKIRLERTRVRAASGEEKEEKLDECVRYLEDVETACLTHG